MKKGCIICLKPVSIFDCEIVEEITRELLEVLLIDIDINGQNEPVICTDCKNKVLECFEFKGKCIYTEDIMYPYIKEGNGLKFDIRLIYSKSNGSNENTGTLYDYKICRLCLERPVGNIYNISEDTLRKNNVDQTFFQKFLPEVNLNATDTPMICENCLACLRSFSQFAFCLPTVEKVLATKTKGSTILLSQNIIEEQILEEGTKSIIYKYDKCDYSSDCQGNVVRPSKKFHEPKEECDKCHSYVKNLKRHYKRFHRMYICKVCDKIFGSAADLRHHMKPEKNAEKIYNCAQCDYSTTDRGHMRVHLVVHQTNRELKYRCDKCSFATTYKCSLTKHSLSHLKKEPSFRCDLCPFATFWSPHLSKHLVSEHNFSENDLNSIVYRCDKCEYSSTNKKYLAHHKIVHMEPGEYRYQCDKCTFATNRVSDLSRHRNNHFGMTKKKRAIKTLQCANCDFTTKDKRVLMNHVMRHSKATKYLYNCDLCAFGSNYRYRVGDHMKQHLPKTDPSLKIYKCDKCKFTSVHRSSMRNHILTHSTERKYRFHCDKCPYTSNAKANFVIHSNTHSANRELNYRCDKCPFASCYKKSLKKHADQHSDNREYNHRCSLCPYVTDLKGNLVQHMKRHAGKKRKRGVTSRDDH